MEARIDFNIEDQYYYPDSDLETIQEEASVLDSEDDRRSLSSRRSSCSTLTSSRLEDESRRSVKLQSSTSTLQGGLRGNHLKSPPSSVDSYSTSSYVSYNGFNDLPHDVTESAHHDSRQKIVYAKCLSANEKPPGNFSAPPMQNGVYQHEEMGTMSAMFQAARQGNLSVLNEFSANELSNTVDEEGNTPLHAAAEHGRLGCLKKLVSHFPPNMVTLPNDDLMTATALAIKNNHLECVQWMARHSSAREELALSQRAASIDGSTNRPPLIHVAARFDRCEILDWLCGEMSRDEIGVDLGDHCSNTPVHVSARYGHLRSIQTLVARGASVTAINSDGDTPGQAARKHGHDTTVGYLVVVETCVSLAQQLVALRSETEGLKAENEKLRKGHQNKPNDVTSPHHSQKPAEEAHDRQKDSFSHFQEDTAAKNEVSNKRRVLEEQPPPPKLWDSPKKKEKALSKTTSASIKGHTAIPPQRKVDKAQDSLQRKLNDILNGPGTVVDGDVTMQMNVSAVDSPVMTSDMAQPNNLLGANDDNSEVEAITRGIDPPAEKKPWERLTMDEMLKKVREIRYQPSPSVSMCTEDSTMESVETMRERMAAASRWFLVEKGREKPQNSHAAHPKHNPQMPQPLSPPYQGHNVRRGPMRPVHHNMTSRPHHQQPNTAKMQNAIQEHYQRVPTSQPPPIRVNGDVYTPPPQPQANGEVHQPKIVSPTNKVPSGTLKFMVSHSKKSMKKSSPTQESKSIQRNTTPPKQPEQKQSPVSGFSPKVPSPISPPAMATTQRSNSYRRAVQVPSRNPSSDSSPTSPSSGGSAPESDHDVTAPKTKKHTAASRKDVSSSERLSKSKKDPLKKRTVKEAPQSFLWAPPQKSVTNHVPNTIVNTNRANERPTFAENREQKVATRAIRYNQWTIPQNNRAPAPSHRGFDEDDEDGGIHVGEAPQLKVDIHPRQNSFLRKVQGKLR